MILDPSLLPPQQFWKGLPLKITPIILQEWNKCYNEFIHSNSYYRTATSMSEISNTDVIDDNNAAQPLCYSNHH